MINTSTVAYSFVLATFMQSAYLVPCHDSIVGADNHQEKVKTKRNDHPRPVGVADQVHPVM